MADILDIKKSLGNVVRLTFDGRMVEALGTLKSLARIAGYPKIGDEVEKLEDKYNAMLRYFATGNQTEDTRKMRDTVISDLLALAMRLSRELSLEDGSELYFSTARTVLSRKDETISSLIKDYKDEVKRLDEDFESLTDHNRTVKSEQILRELFNRIWVTHPLTAEDFDAIEGMMSPAVASYARALVISAVSLGHISYYDSKRLEWLLSVYLKYADSEYELSLRAIIEALVSMLRYKRRPLTNKVRNIFSSVIEHPQWEKDFASIAIELMRATGTRSLSEKMQDGFLNRLEGLESELREKLQNGELNLEEISSEFNPDWEEDGSDNSFRKSMMEIAEIQADGGDVFMSSFSRMKRYPFFHELPNWFLPFYESHSAVVSSDSSDGFITSILAKMPILCDSDKYSLALSLSSVPENQREQLGQAMRMQAEQMHENLSEIEKASKDFLRRHFINKYVQNLYRFVNLFRSKNDFFNVFSLNGQNPDLLQVNIPGKDEIDLKLYHAIADFYFKNHLWEEAAKAFEYLDEREGPAPRRTQQMAYALEKSGRTDMALRRYEEAEMLDGGSEWTLRRLAALLRRQGDFKDAANYYKRLSDSFPDDADLSLAAAECFLDAGLYDEAEKAFRKTAYLMPASIGAQRGLAWSLFLNKKAEKAWEIYNDILGKKPDNEDFQRAGFVRWAIGDIPSTIELFKKSLSNRSDMINELNSEISQNAEVYRAAGIDVSKQQDMIETLRLILHDN